MFLLALWEGAARLGLLSAFFFSSPSEIGGVIVSWFRAGRVFNNLAVTLTESGSEELGPYLGPNAHVVRGRYLAATERGLAISVESVESRRGDLARWAGETVVVPGEFVRAVEQRQVSRSKMVLLAGAAVAGLAAVYQAFGPGSGGDLGGAGGPSGPSPR